MQLSGCWFSPSFSFIRIENIPQSTEPLLAALNCLLRAVAVDCRSQVCSLGEDFFPLLIQIWKKKSNQPQKVDKSINKFYCFPSILGSWGLFTFTYVLTNLTIYVPTCTYLHVPTLTCLPFYLHTNCSTYLSTHLIYLLTYLPTYLHVPTCTYMYLP